MAKRYVFDAQNISFRRVGRTVGSVLLTTLKWVLAVISLSVLYYIVASFFFSTDVEKELLRENEAYEAHYLQLQEQKEVLSDVVEGLQRRDDEIYGQVFHAKAPVVDPLSLLGGKGGPVDSLAARASRVEKSFVEVFDLLARTDTLPPLASPLGKVSYIRIGASTGMRYSPYYKVSIRHDGLDIIASQGDPVFAADKGTVQAVLRSSKGLGNQVTINHGNGYITRYCHLSSINVSKGQKVRRGQQIAEVGISGNSYAPHLHYEVIFRDKVMDPVNYLFGSLSPEEYVKAAYMAARTGQSLD